MTLLHAFEAVLRARPQPLQLVLAGRKGWLVDDFFTSLKRSPAAERIVVTGYLCDEDLCALYSSCSAFVYPSIYEGFGLPPLEAMACGAPVIASRIPSIEEVTGSAARLVRPGDVVEFSRVLIDVLGHFDERQRLLSAGARRTASFSWSQTARLTRDVYSEALERTGRKKLS
jgi:glycosyltransferase involved in cell wall biosynthesis